MPYSLDTPPLPVITDDFGAVSPGVGYESFCQGFVWMAVDGLPKIVVCAAQESRGQNQDQAEKGTTCQCERGQGLSGQIDILPGDGGPSHRKGSTGGGGLCNK